VTDEAPCCGNCQYFVPDHRMMNRDADFVVLGRCRRHAPVPDPRGSGTWPSTVDEVWCGDHEPKKRSPT
jgi:hypothetical protein